MDVDAEGNAYITGNSCSTDFPTTAGSPQENSSNPYAASCEDAFVLKLNPTASTLLYSDFVGGSGISSGTHIAVDDSGNAYVTGATSSANFPLISNIGPSTPRACALFKPFDTDCMDGFILKLNPEGSGIVFSSLLGGNESSLGFQVKLNPVTGDVVVLGETDSADFLPAPTELEATFGGGNCFIEIPCFNGFLLGLNPTTGSLRYGTFLGGEKNNWATGLAFDLSGNIFVTGSSQPPLSTVGL